MKTRKCYKLIALYLTLFLMLGMCACENNNVAINTANTNTVITDMLGRNVEIPTKINTIICNGSNALRMVSYLKATDMMVGVEETDKGYETSTKRDYAHVYYDVFKDMNVIGKGGGTAYTAYPEEILKVNPDVILTSFVQEAAQQLQNETGIPVVSIRCASTNFIDENWYATLRLTAEITGTQERCEELLSYIDECKADLKERSSTVADENKPTVYAGALTSFLGAPMFLYMIVKRRGIQ